MAAYHSEYITDLALPPVQRPIPHQFVIGDSDAYTFTALVCDSRTPSMGLLAGDVTGSLVRPDGATVVFVGTKAETVQEVKIPQPDGDELTCNATACSVTLPQASFAYPGRVTMLIKLTDGSTITQALDVSALVLRTATGMIVDPGTVIPDPGYLYYIAQEAEAAAADAEAAAQHSVRYDEEQELTQLQQSTARTNIGAASDSDLTAEITARGEGDASTLSDAKGYADGIVGTEARDRQAGDASTLSDAKGYADGLVTDVIRYSAQSLTDEQKAQASANIGAATSSEITSAVAGEAALRVSGDADTLTAAKGYADGVVGSEASARQGGDADTLSAAKSYADGVVGTETTARQSADSTLETAIGNRVRYDAAQTLTDAQKAQARTNIGAVGASDVPTGVVRYDAAQTLTDAQKRQAQENMQVDPASAVRFMPVTAGYIRVESASTATSVVMENNAPVITDDPNGSTQKFRYSLIEVEEGQWFTCIAQGMGQATPGALVIAADGTILARITGTSSYQRLVWKMPANAKWFYCVYNVASSGYGRNSRFYEGGLNRYRIDGLEAEVTALTPVVESITGATPTITAVANHSYKCTGTVTEMHFTPCATGLCEVRFTTGSTPVWDDQTGAVMPAWFTGLEAGYTYEMSFQDGYGVVMAWPTT